LDYTLAIDLGGTNIRVALCDDAGHILKQETHPTRAQQGAEDVFARLVAHTRALADDWSRVRGIGLAAPGPLDPWRGIIHQAPNIPGIDGFEMQTRLEKEFHIPARVGNDANLAALGEHRLGAGRGVADMIYITISTGIGGGIIAHNELFLGARGFAGEIGHQTIDAYGPLCNCGSVGCLEALASGPAIARATRDEIFKGRESKILGMVNNVPSAITASVVSQAARAGDKLARRMFERAGFYIGLGLVSLLHNFDTQLFVLGGGVVIHSWDLLEQPIRTTFAKYAMASMRAGVRIAQAELGDDAGLVGAAALVNEQMSK
jgi:glucokinase